MAQTLSSREQKIERPVEGAGSAAPPALLIDRRRQPRTRRMPPRTMRLHNYDLPGFAGVAADFGSRDYAYVVTPNVDHLLRFCDDESFRELYSQAGFILNDSRLLSRVVSAAKGINLRVCTGSDLTEHLLSRVVKSNDRIVVVGASSEQAKHLAHRFGLKSLRHTAPPMGFINDPKAVDACLSFIEAQSPFRFCFLAVGSPQQEILANMLRERGIARGLTLCIGASIDFLTDVEKRAPRWIQQLSMEWAFRLLQNPRRLAKRYLVRGPRVFLMLKHIKFELLSPASAVAPLAEHLPMT